MFIAIICPVRNVSPEVSARLEAYVHGLEAGGHRVHWPQRDTDQTDPHGLAICKWNVECLRRADEVHIWYDPASQGSLFDLGAAYSAHLGKEKRFVLINCDQVMPTTGKSFANVVLALSRH